MTTPGQIPGVYNIVTADSFETVQDQLSVESFIDNLDSNAIKDEVTVVGLEKAFNDDSLIAELSRTMDRRADDLENADPKPMIQFVVDADIHRGTPTFDLFYDGEIYSLQKVFGRQLESRTDDNAWLTSPF